MAYSPERREAVLKKMVPPNAISIAELAKQENISEPTLYGWRAKARRDGLLMPDSDATPQGWSSRDKFAAVLETASMSEAETGEYCRQKGLTREQLTQWRSACEQANDWDQATTAKTRSAAKAAEKEKKKLKAELARKEKALAEAAALLVLREKLAALYAKDEDE